MNTVEIDREPVLISTGKVTLIGLLDLPPSPTAAVIVANGLGRLRRPIAESYAFTFNNEGFATLLFNLLTPDELQFDSRTAHFSSSSEFQSERLLDAVHWVYENPSTSRLPLAAVAAGPAARGLLRAAGTSTSPFRALIIDGGVRPGDVPTGLTVPTLLLAADDPIQLKGARGVVGALAGRTRMEILPPASPSDQRDPFFGDASAQMSVRWLRDVLRD